MITGNIDIHDARYNTNTPFAIDCSLSVAGVSVPAGMFRCIRLHCPEGTVFPCRIAGISIPSDRPDVIMLSLADSADVPMGSWSLRKPDDSSGDCGLFFICTDNHVLRGYAACSRDLYALLYSAVSASSGTSVSIQDDFRLLPECCVPYFRGKLKSISALDRTTCADFALAPETYTRAYTGEYPAGDTHTWMLGAVDRLDLAEGTNGICRLVLQYPGSWKNLWAGGVNLLINNTPESNVRTMAKGGKIKIAGVMDSWR